MSRKRAFFAITLILLCSFGAPLSAQDTGTTVEQPAALSVTTAQATPLSDAQKLALAQQISAAFSISDSGSGFVLSGTATTHYGEDQSARFKVEVASNGDSLFSVDTPAGQRSESTSSIPDNCYFVSADGRKHERPSSDCAAAASWIMPQVFIRGFVQGNIRVVEVKADLERGVINIRLQRVLSQGTDKTKGLYSKSSEVLLSLDAKTMLPRELSFVTHPDDNSGVDIPIRVEYSGFQQIGGYTVPSQIQKFVNNSLVMELNVDSAETRATN